MLKVERIPRPPPTDDVWRSYTNVIFANGTLLVPSYPDADEKTEARALDVYAKLLPGWTIIPLDVSDLIREGGALRCISMNVPAELR
jgi:agmatine/peptidylarginine deiminase